MTISMITTMPPLLSLIRTTTIILFILGILLFLIVPIITAVLSKLLFVLENTTKNKNSSSTNYTSSLKSCLYFGRVWHTRLLPKIHSFTYPIFIFAIDLSEIEYIQQRIWRFPLNYLLSFQESDHLINGEGMSMITTKGDDDDDDDRRKNSNSLEQRILRLVSEKTNGKFIPTSNTHRVVILTHLRYYGYNFNPVSFYYIIEKVTSSGGDDEKKLHENVVAIVGEVSNTPWQEMYCYVLHPDSVDNVQVFDTNNKNDTNNDTTTTTKIRYQFPKQFHVSPFMEMEYYYDWTFDGIPTSTTATKKSSSTSSLLPPITVINTLRQKNDTSKIQFTATLKLNHHDDDKQQKSKTIPLNQHFQLVYYTLVRYPIYCMIIQIWIHYEAMLLFIKGITYIPHPLGSETMASTIIATIMTPFFAIRDYVDSFKSQSKSKSTSKSTTTTTTKKED